MNPVIDCLLDHRSVRKYKPEAIEPEMLQTILEAGTRAATGGNLQLYTFVVIDDPEKLSELGKAVGDAMNAPAAIVALADQYRTRRWFETFGVPAEAICNNCARHFFLAVWDTLIALQNMVVAAESFGLGTCYIGNILAVDCQKLFGTPEHVFPIGMVYVGYPATRPDKSMRLPLEAVVHRNQYHEPSDEDIKRFYAERNRVWDNLSDELKERLAERGIHSIPQGVARRKYGTTENEKATDATKARGVLASSRAVLANLARAGFDLTADR